MIEKIDEFLFDIMGLFLPGLICLALFLLLPFSIISDPELTELTQKSVKIILFINDTKIDYKAIYIILIIACYIFGHVIKVFSTIFYELGKTVFDETLFKWCNKIYIKVFKREFIESQNVILKFIYNQFRQIIKFKADYYDPKFESMYITTRDKLAVDKGIEYFSTNSDWYPFYKSAEIISHKAVFGEI